MWTRAPFSNQLKWINFKSAIKHSTLYHPIHITPRTGRLGRKSENKRKKTCRETGGSPPPSSSQRKQTGFVYNSSYVHIFWCECSFQSIESTRTHIRTARYKVYQSSFPLLDELRRQMAARRERSPWQQLMSAQAESIYFVYCVRWRGGKGGVYEFSINALRRKSN